MSVTLDTALNNNLFTQRMEKKKLKFKYELITVKYRLHTAATIHVFFYLSGCEIK